MSLGQRSGKQLLFLVMVFALLLAGGTHAYAQSSEPKLGKTAVLYGQEGSFDQSLQLSDPSDSPTIFGIISRIIVFFFVLTGIAVAVIHYGRKGKLSLSGLKPVGAENRLLILETKMLGNRQYLTVVEYNEQKMLLGVSPGKVEHLCFLESVFEEEEREAELELEREIG